MFQTFYTNNKGNLGNYIESILIRSVTALILCDEISVVAWHGNKTITCLQLTTQTKFKLKCRPFINHQYMLYLRENKVVKKEQTSDNTNPLPLYEKGSKQEKKHEIPLRDNSLLRQCFFQSFLKRCRMPTHFLILQAGH